MPQPPASSGAGRSPFKLALASVLSVVFLVVLIVQCGNISSGDDVGSGKAAGKGKRETSRGTSSAAAVRDQAELETAEDSAQPWPVVELADVLEYDPFATPPAFSDQDSAAPTRPQDERRQAERNRREELLRKQAEQEKALEKLRQEGVKAILGSSQSGNVAVIGSRTVHVGDELDGFRVVAIEPDGVVLVRLHLEANEM